MHYETILSEVSEVQAGNIKRVHYDKYSGNRPRLTFSEYIMNLHLDNLSGIFPVAEVPFSPIDGFSFGHTCLSGQ